MKLCRVFPIPVSISRGRSGASTLESLASGEIFASIRHRQASFAVARCRSPIEWAPFTIDCAWLHHVLGPLFAILFVGEGIRGTTPLRRPCRACWPVAFHIARNIHEHTGRLVLDYRRCMQDTAEEAARNCESRIVNCVYYIRLTRAAGAGNSGDARLELFNRFKKSVICLVRFGPQAYGASSHRR
jgi:hypothetical protein